MEKEFNSNTCYIQGEILTEPKMFIKDSKARYVKVDLKVARKNIEESDTISVAFNKDFVTDEMKVGEKLAVKGVLKTEATENSKELGNVYVLVDRFNTYREDMNGNRIFLVGELVKQPEYKVTKQNKSVCNAMIKVETTENNFDYVPFVAWGETAQVLSTYEKGTKIEVKARLSTRTIKKIEDDVVVEQHEIPELSVYNITLK